MKKLISCILISQCCFFSLNADSQLRGETRELGESEASNIVPLSESAAKNADFTAHTWTLALTIAATVVGGMWTLVGMCCIGLGAEPSAIKVPGYGTVIVLGVLSIIDLALYYGNR